MYNTKEFCCNEGDKRGKKRKEKKETNDILR